MSLIPTLAWVIASIVFFLPPIAVFFFAHSSGMPEMFFMLIAGGLTGAMLAGSALLAGYIYGDAPRRGMSRAGWTLLAIFAPNGIGFILYFVMRKPIQHPCANCANGVEDGAAFCSRCGAAQFAMAR